MSYSTVYTRAELDEVCATLDSLPPEHVVSFDAETTGLSPMTDTIVGFSLSWAEAQAVYIPTWIADMEQLQGFGFHDAEPVLRRLKRLRVIAHKWVFDSTFAFTNFGVALPCWDDTMLLAKLACLPAGLKDLMVDVFHLDPNLVKEFKDLMVHHFGVQYKSKGHTTAELPLGQGEWDVDRYCCQDADYCRRTYFYAKPYLKQYNLTSLHKVEVNLLPFVRKLNLTGAPADPVEMEFAVRQVRENNDQLERDIYAAAGHEFKINSPRDAAQLFFEQLKLPVILRSKKTGMPSTSKEVLEQLEGMHPLVDMVKEWRETARMLSAYLVKIPAQVRESKESRLYSEFDSLGAVSGRFTSSSTEDLNGEDHGLNLQNISKKRYKWVDESGAARQTSVRAAFKPPAGFTWVRLDYDQIEPKVQASLSQEEYLLENFRNGIDSHTTTTCVCYGLTPEAVKADTLAGGSKRKKGKIINLALSYGMGVDKLARSLHCSKEEAEHNLQRYWNQLPKLAAAVEASKEELLRTNRIRTFFGRIRIIDVYALKKFDPQGYDSALRKSWNTRMQGTAAELLKIGMLRVFNAIKPFGKDVQLCLTVHDELDLIVKTERLFEALPVIRRAFEVPVPKNWAEITASVGYGPSWDEVELIEYTERDPEPFVSWAKVLPVEFESHFEPEMAALAAA